MSLEDQAQEVMPAASIIPDTVSDDGSSLQLGYTEADPSGPKPADGEGLILGKFKSQADLEKAYQELESKVGQPKQPEDTLKLPEVDPNAPQVAALSVTDEAAETLKEVGLDIVPFQREFETSGQLSNQSYAALEKAGIPRDVVDSYIAGQRVLVDTQVADVKNSVGGEEVYAKMMGWAQTNLTPEERADYDTAMKTNNLGLIKLAAAGLKARFDSVMGRDPKVMLGGATPNTNSVPGYENMAQMLADIKDSQYDTDPAYRDRVLQKANNSKF